MKLRLFALACMTVAVILSAWPAAALAGGRIISAVLGTGATENDEITGAASTFAPDIAKIYCTWVADGADLGAPVRGAWIATDVGAAAPANHKIDEASVELSESGTGTFTLSKPNAGFPVGKYRIEIYLDKRLAKTVPFTIQGK
jgi:hypothetical protein